MAVHTFYGISKMGQLSAVSIISYHDKLKNTFPGIKVTDKGKYIYYIYDRNIEEENYISRDEYFYIKGIYE